MSSYHAALSLPPGRPFEPAVLLPAEPVHLPTLAPAAHLQPSGHGMHMVCSSAAGLHGTVAAAPFIAAPSCQHQLPAARSTQQAADHHVRGPFVSAAAANRPLLLDRQASSSAGQPGLGRRPLPRDARVQGISLGLGTVHEAPPWQPALQSQAPMDLCGSSFGSGMLAHQSAIAAAAQQQPALAAAAVPEAPPAPAPGRRKAGARRSLSSNFDVAAVATPEKQHSSNGSLAAMDSFDSEAAEVLLYSQGSSTSIADGASPLGPATPQAPGALPPVDEAGPSSSAAPCEADPHMLPLQHMLMSERAQSLSSLEVKAIVYKVTGDLCRLHDAGMLHRHVTIASVAINRSGNLATARLMPHPRNAGAGAARRFVGRKAAGADAYLAPELARCPGELVAHTPACDMWSLGVLLFALLSGAHVPFGSSGLCWTSVPNMPGPTETVDRLQRWLQEHMDCKVSVINEMSLEQECAAEPRPMSIGASGEMRIIGFDPDGRALLMGLLHADPAQRLTASQVLRHPWLTEVVDLIPAPMFVPQPAAAPAPIPLASHPRTPLGASLAPAGGAATAAAAAAQYVLQQRQQAEAAEAAHHRQEAEARAAAELAHQAAAAAFTQQQAALAPRQGSLGSQSFEEALLHFASTSHLAFYPPATPSGAWALGDADSALSCGCSLSSLDAGCTSGAHAHLGAYAGCDASLDDLLAAAAATELAAASAACSDLVAGQFSSSWDACLGGHSMRG